MTTACIAAEVVGLILAATHRGRPMIDKLIRLKHTGVFDDGLPNGAIPFGRCTVIYGENGRGKSTLSHLLRSLSTGDCGCLKPRATIGGGSQPSAELLISGSHHSLKGYTWTPPRADISIYDAEFVNRNVHSGSGVTAGHRSNLCRFVLGEEGVGLALTVDQLNDEVTKASKAIADAEAALKPLVGTDMTVDGFLGLPSAPDIDAKIASAQKLVDAAADAEDVLKHAGLVRIGIPPVPTPAAVGTLAETIEDLSADAVAIVRRHVLEHLGEGGEAWLRTGVEYVTDDRCPFCGQETKGVDLLDAFRKYFGEAYEVLVTGVKTESRNLAAPYSEAKLSGLKATVSANAIAREYWAKYAAVGSLPSGLGVLDDLWGQVADGLLPLFAEKLADPSNVVASAEAMAAVAASHATAAGAVASYNQQVDDINSAVTKCKETLSEANVTTHTAALRRLRLQKRRFDEDVVRQCEAVREARKLKKGKEGAKETAKKAFNKHVREFADDYCDAVNDFLIKCDAAFRIENIKPTFTGGDARSDYSIGLFGKTITASAKPDDSPHFDTALSEGDKRALAFAFFLARIQRDASIGKKIVVLDDPVASLDAHRRRCTIEVIVDLATKCGQLIVMTHDPHFAHDVAKALTQAGMNKGGGLATLALRRSGSWSVIRECDPSDICQVAYEASVEDLHAFAADPSTVPALDALRSIRPAIEGLLRIKYPLELKGRREVGQMVKAIEECGEGSRLVRLRDQVKELYAVTGYATDYIHVDDPHSLVVPQEGEAMGYVKRALVLLDTL